MDVKSVPNHSIKTTSQFKQTNNRTINICIFFLTFILIGCGGSDKSTENIETPTPNIAPTAFAGDDHTVIENDNVTLSGSGTDSDGAIATYLWQQLEGVSVTIENNDSHILLRQKHPKPFS